MKTHHFISQLSLTFTSTSISEDMGQIEYIFSDKTGTLTENRMIFKKCSIQGTLFDDMDRHTLNEHALAHIVKKKQPEVMEFFKVLCLCHTVVASQYVPNLTDLTERVIMMRFCIKRLRLMKKHW